MISHIAAPGDDRDEKYTMDAMDAFQAAQNGDVKHTLDILNRHPHPRSKRGEEYDGSRIIDEWNLLYAGHSPELLEVLIMRGGTLNHNVRENGLLYGGMFTGNVLLEKIASMAGGYWGILQSMNNHMHRNIELLLQHRADVNAQNNHGLTPLMVCATLADIPLVTFQLMLDPPHQQSVDLSLQDDKGHDALYFACYVRDAMKNENGEAWYNQTLKVEALQRKYKGRKGNSSQVLPQKRRGCLDRFWKTWFHVACRRVRVCKR